MTDLERIAELLEENNLLLHALLDSQMEDITTSYGRGAHVPGASAPRWGVTGEPRRPELALIESVPDDLESYGDYEPQGP